MASLSIPYPDFVAGTTIVSQQVDDNNAAILNYINARNDASGTWDAVKTVGAFTSTLTSNQIILGTTRTVTITAPTPASSSRVHTIPDISAAGTFAFLEGTQTFSGSKTFSAAVAMSAQKITGLANGTASTDAAAFGQIKYIQAVMATTSTATNTTSSTFVDTNLAVTLSITSASSRVKLTLHGSLGVAVTANNAELTIRRASNLASTDGFAILKTPQAATCRATVSAVYIDSPASTGSTTYTVQIRATDGANTVNFVAGGETCVIVAEEIV